MRLSVYCRQPRSYCLIVAYADNLLVPENEADVKVAKQKLAKFISVADPGKCCFCLGVKLDYWKNRRFPSQPVYITSILEAAKIS